MNQTMLLHIRNIKHYNFTIILFNNNIFKMKIKIVILMIFLKLYNQMIMKCIIIGSIKNIFKMIKNKWN